MRKRHRRVYWGALFLYGGSTVFMLWLLGWIVLRHPLVAGVGGVVGIVALAALTRTEWRTPSQTALIRAAWRQMGEERRDADVRKLPRRDREVS